MKVFALLCLAAVALAVQNFDSPVLGPVDRGGQPVAAPDLRLENKVPDPYSNPNPFPGALPDVVPSDKDATTSGTNGVAGFNGVVPFPNPPAEYLQPVTEAPTATSPDVFSFVEVEEEEGKPKKRKSKKLRMPKKLKSLLREARASNGKGPIKWAESPQAQKLDKRNYKILQEEADRANPAGQGDVNVKNGTNGKTIIVEIVQKQAPAPVAAPAPAANNDTALLPPSPPAPATPGAPVATPGAPAAGNASAAPAAANDGKTVNVRVQANGATVVSPPPTPATPPAPTGPTVSVDKAGAGGINVQVNLNPAKKDGKGKGKGKAKAKAKAKAKGKGKGKAAAAGPAVINVQVENQNRKQPKGLLAAPASRKRTTVDIQIIKPKAGGDAAAGAAPKAKAKAGAAASAAANKMFQEANSALKKLQGAISKVELQNKEAATQAKIAAAKESKAAQAAAAKAKAKAKAKSVTTVTTISPSGAMSTATKSA